jgi:hypothetical protein
MFDTDMSMPPPDHPDVQDTLKLTQEIQPMLFTYSTFVISCAFGWLLGQFVRNDQELTASIRNIEEAGRATLHAREDNGHV